MKEVLEFIFSSFWVFTGTILLVAVLCDGIVDIVKAIKR